MYRPQRYSMLMAIMGPPTVRVEVPNHSDTHSYRALRSCLLIDSLLMSPIRTREEMVTPGGLDDNPRYLGCRHYLPVRYLLAPSVVR